MYILVIDKIFNSHEYRCQTASDVCDLLFKIKNADASAGDFHLFFWREGMTDRFDLAIRAEHLPINPFNREMLRAQRDFETEMHKRMIRELNEKLNLQENNDGNTSNNESTNAPRTSN
jgi:hypothetical protein